MKSTLLSCAFLFITIFGKAQWVLQTSNITAGLDVQFIDAVSPDVCWGLVADPANQSNPIQEYTRTINGGTTWAGGVITNAPGLCPSSICAINADTAWVAMFNPSGGAGRILRTDDGGVNWTHQTTALFNSTGNFPNWVYFWTPDSGICMGDPTLGYLEIYTTADGGNNWIRLPQTEIPNHLTGEFGITDVFRGDNTTNLWFGTNLGRIYHTTDRGFSWTVSQTPFTDFIGAIAFRDANNGLCASGGATGSADVARTTDGGATWSLVGTNTAGMTLKQGLCHVPGTDSTYFISTPYAGSIDGTTFSPNDGNSWIPVDNLIHTDIEFVNDSIGWTGSNELNAPMYKWMTPIVVALDDASSQSIDVADNTGLITQIPQATFLNNGLNTQTFDVTMRITGGYSSTKTISNLVFYNTIQVDFDPWTPASTGAYIIDIYTSLGTDTDHLNDSLIKSVTVYEAFDNCGWVAKPDVPAGTFGLAGAFYLDGLSSSSPGTVFSIGGADFTAVQPVMNAFETVPNSWLVSTPMPSAKYQFCAHTVGTKIVCAGGYSGGFTPDQITYIYDVVTGLWSTGLDMPIPVGDYASGVYNDSLIYYIGGFDGGLDQNLVQIYDVANDIWGTASIKPGDAVAGLRGSISGDKIVIAGGYSQTLASTLADAYIGAIDPINPATITWSPLPPYPAGTTSRIAAGAVFMDFRPLVIFAGGDPTGQGVETMEDCWGYDVSANEWLIGSAKSTAVSNISNLIPILHNDTLYMGSASGYDGSVITTVHEWLCLGQQLWTGIENNPATVSNTFINVYPSPASEELTIRSSFGKGSMTISDVTGRIVLKNDFNAFTSTINIGLLEPGIYSVSLLSDKGQLQSSFVIE